MVHFIEGMSFDVYSWKEGRCSRKEEGCCTPLPLYKGDIGTVRMEEATTWYFSANWRAFFSISSLSDRAARHSPHDSFSSASFDLPDSLVSSSLHPSTRVVPRALTDSSDSEVFVNPLSKSCDVIGNTFLC